ncbi:hypothetical protein GOV12_05795 [Candidatus Pacearchaeota archaeon]|nr:hypothetical protein [Candidatus Pacearchaeota archaeon]
MINVNDYNSRGNGNGSNLVPDHVRVSEEIRHYAQLASAGVKLPSLVGHIGPMPHDESLEGHRELADFRAVSLD